MQQNPSIALARPPSGLLVRETSILLGIAIAVPILVHLIPSQTVPWGARLLPMFYAPLLGVTLYRLHVGLIPAALAPLLNALITGSPATGLLGILTVELIVFTISAYALLRVWPSLWAAGPLAYLAAKAVSAVAIAGTPWLAAFRPASDFAMASIKTAVPGLLLLTVIAMLGLQIRARSTGEPE